MVANKVSIIIPPILLDNKNLLNGPNFQIYPNPFSQQFTLDMEGLPGKKNIKMYDCKGQLVLDTETNENALTLAPEISEGVYFVTIMNGNKMSGGKVVKLK